MACKVWNGTSTLWMATIFVFSYESFIRKSSSNTLLSRWLRPSFLCWPFVHTSGSWTWPFHRGRSCRICRWVGSETSKNMISVFCIPWSNSHTNPQSRFDRSRTLCTLVRSRWWWGCGFCGGSGWIVSRWWCRVRCWCSWQFTGYTAPHWPTLFCTGWRCPRAGRNMIRSFPILGRLPSVGATLLT